MKDEKGLIAEFMGAVLEPQEKYGYAGNWAHSPNIWVFDGALPEPILKYDTSWDWLMPVVEKIEARDITLVNIYSDATKIWVDDSDQNELFSITSHGNKDNKIGHVYRAVVEFIKWHNANQS